MRRRATSAAALVSFSLLIFACGGSQQPKAEPPAKEPPKEEVPNSPPIAVAGEGRVAPVGALVELDGRGSHDPDGDALSFRWSLLSVPEGSEASLVNPSSRTPRFSIDRSGPYEIELVVSDGSAEASDRVVVHGNALPIADAGGAVVGAVGEELTLDGSGSTDEDGDELEFGWSFVSRPEGSAAALGRRNTAKARLILDLVGVYVVELSVTDGISTVKDRVAVTVQAAPGFSGSVLHVRPGGDDEGVGTAASPLSTIGEALERLHANPAIKRIQLGAGVYEEAFAYEITGAATIVGPSEEGAQATLRGAGTLFSLRDEGRLSLIDLTVESQETVAIARGIATTIHWERVSCLAARCVSSGLSISTRGGSVQIHDSILDGGGSPFAGVQVVHSPKSIIVSNSEIRGFYRGLWVAGAPLLVEESELVDNETGVEVSGQGGGASKVEIVDCLIGGGDVGIVAKRSKEASIRGSELYALGTGLVIEGSSVNLVRSSFSGLNGAAIHTRTELSSSPDILHLRNATFDSIAGPNLLVEGISSYIDLGTQTSSGQNSFRSSYIPILDRRPAASEGLITLRGNNFDGSPPPVGEHVGPYSSPSLRIENTGNKVIVY